MGLRHLTINDFPTGSVYNATAAPTINDDIDLGHNVGNLWLDTTNDKAYICLDNTDGAAVWTEITVSGGATTLPQLTDVDSNLLPISPTAADDGKLLFYNFSTGLWETDDAVTFGTIVLDCYSGEAGAIAKGTPVYLTGVFANDVHEVKIADADGVGTFPVAGFAAESLSTNSLTPGKIIKYGKIQGIDTSGTSVLNADAPTAWNAGDDLYISTTAGKLTTTRPAGGSTSIQEVAKVLRVDALGGQLLVYNTNRDAGLPNLTTDYIWQGDGSSHPQEVYPWVPPMTDVSSGATGQSAALLTIPAWNDPPGPDPAVGGIGTFRNFAAADNEEWAFQVPLYNNGLAYDGRNITIDIHWMIFDAADPGALEDVVWEVDYYFGRDGVDVYDAVTAGIYVSNPPPGITTTVNLNGRIGSPGSGQVQYTDTIASAISGPAGSTTLHVVIKRQGATDTYGGAGEIYGITFR